MSIYISVPTAKALLKFASNDKHQPHIFGIGITNNGLAATDGFAAVEFILSVKPIEDLVGRTIDRKYFETSTKIAAITKVPLTINTVNTGNLVESQLSFPNVSALAIHAVRQPDLPGTELVTDSIRVNPQYLTLLDLVAVACEVETVELISVKSDGPLRFKVTGPTQSANVVISQG